MINGVLNINGVPVKRERLEDKIEDTKCGPHMPVHVYRETLPNGRSYLTQKLSETCPIAGWAQQTTPRCSLCRLSIIS